MRKVSVIVSIAAIAIAIVVTSSARPRVMGRTPAASAEEKATVKLSNFKFEPKVLTVASGTTVEWVNEAGRHTVEADDGSFKSDVLTAGGRFEHKFDKPGTFAYHCGFHGDKGGKDMAGKIIVTRARK